MAYAPFDITKPSGASIGSTFASDLLNNELALRDAVLMGQMDGFIFSQSGGTAAQPASMFWKSGATWLQGAFTWGSGAGQDGNPTQIIWSVSYNTGSTYVTIDTQTFTWDSSGNLTATTGAGGWVSWLTGLLGKMKALTATVAGHTTSISGLGTMSTQAASAVAVTGGTINGASIGQTTPAVASFTRATEQVNAQYNPGSGAGVTLDWSNGNSVIANSGTNAITFSNVAATGMATHMVYVTNFNANTWPAALPSANWGAAGKPSFATAAWVQLWTKDGGTTMFGAVIWK